MRFKFLILLCFPISASAQQGIKFLENTTWENVVALAKQQNKMIFVDCYASWCVPCKVIDQAVFKTEVAGDYFNQNFINYKVQMDTAKTDGLEKIEHYPDAKKLKALAEVVNYPTYAFFSSNGEMMHRFVGGTQDPEEFIKMAAAAHDPDRQFYTLKQQLENSSNPDRGLLKRAAMAYQRNADYKNDFDDKSRTLASEYIRKSSAAELLTKENIDFMRRFTSSTSHNGFAFFLDHSREIDSASGKGMSFDLIERCIFHSLIDPELQAEKVPNWNHLDKSLRAKYPDYTDLLVRKAKISYYSKIEDWPAYIQVVNQMVNLKTMDGVETDLSNYAFEVYRHTSEKACLKEALKWSERSLTKSRVTEELLIIHASILYALGAQKDAVSCLTRAEAMASEPQMKGYIHDTLKKVRANLPLLERK